MAKYYKSPQNAGKVILENSDLKIFLGGWGGGENALTPIEKFAPLVLIQILAPSGLLGLGTILNLQRASPYNLESMLYCLLHERTTVFPGE